MTLTAGQSATAPVPRDRPVRVRINLVGVILPIVLVSVALLFALVAATLDGWHFGPVSATTGTIESSPTHHAVIVYSVDGVNYRLQTSDNNPSWRIGQTVDIVYDPRHPARASTSMDRVTGLSLAGAASVAGVAGLAWAAGTAWRWRRDRDVVRRGQVVVATITSVTQQPTVHLGNKIMTRLTCQWTTPDRVDHSASSVGRFMARGTTLADLPVTAVPVYYDPDNPSRCYVDDAVMMG